MKMSDLLLIGDATDEMKGRFAEKFAIHILYDNEDPAAWIVRHGSKISYVATNGHDGVKSAFVDSMPNLKAISCYGVGYDSIDSTGCFPWNTGHSYAQCLKRRSGYHGLTFDLGVLS
jgi:lactate dehydrogenase-like 2-hydroxyacid dehydrogenase